MKTTTTIAFLLQTFLLCAFLYAPQVLAGEEMTINQFLDLIEENLLTDEQICLFAEGARIEEPLRRAQRQKRTAVVKRLLSARDAQGDTALIKAVEINDIDRVRILLEAGAHPNGANPINILKVIVPGYGIKSSY